VARTVEEKLEDARYSLLDLTLRNRLINYKPRKERSIAVRDEEPRELYDILVLREKRMQFRAGRGNGDPEGENEESDETPSTIWEPPEPDAEPLEHHRDQYLETSLEPEILQKRLFKIAQEAQSILDEQGYTVLYLALGFLEWCETQASSPCRAPLVLIPVTLERDQVRTAYKLAWTGEDMMTNVSLQAKLREFQVELPTFEMPERKEGIDGYFQAVADAVATKSWPITRDINLGFFNFARFVMFKDLDPAAWPADSSPADHPLIDRIFNPNASLPPSNPFPEDAVDQRLPASSVYHVLDADSSQIAVIEDLKSGQSLVIEGPPGTGKSQTIANVIAEYLANGKTILFVSEKMAALEVVKGRLDELGLGIFCLELHNSKKVNRRKVLQEIARAAKYRSDSGHSTYGTITEVERLKGDLNGYVEALSAPIGQRAMTPYSCYGVVENRRHHFNERGISVPHVDLCTPDAITQAEWDIALTALRSLTTLLPRVMPVAENPWRHCHTRPVFPADSDRLLSDIAAVLDRLAKVEACVDQLVEYAGISRAATATEVIHAIEATRLLSSPDPVEQAVLLNDAWNRPDPVVDALIQKVEDFQTERTALLEVFNDAVLDADIALLQSRLAQEGSKFLASLRGGYKQVRAEIEAQYRDPGKHSDIKLNDDLTRVQNCVDQRADIRRSNEFGRNMFGSRWHGEESDPAMLRAFSSWILEFRQHLIHDVLTERSVELISRGVQPVRITAIAGSIRGGLDELNGKFATVGERVGADLVTLFPQGLENTPFTELQMVLQRWQSGIDDLAPWSRYLAVREACAESVAEPLLALVEKGALDPGDLQPVFELAYAEGLLRLAYQVRPALVRFDGLDQERRQREFAEADMKMIHDNRTRLIARICLDRPPLIPDASSSSMVGVLLRQINRKKAFMPIRQLMIKAGPLIQKYKPCFMMSPASIAIFLDPRAVQFDLVLFDEASQVRPADALGALLRGRQVGVIGDSQQLPPTSFFDKIVEASESSEDDETQPSDMESILNLCRTRFPTRILKWHYRSRHDTLIALSNQEFYQNDLFVYPSPMREDEGLGLKFVHLPETIYDRGRSMMNRGEAKAVAKAVIEHARTTPERSLGVGCFNIKQQEAILEELELVRRDHPELENFFRAEGKEAFFVKNLETIQGDERDVIFLSIGYGRDAQGRMSLNFGALNKDGGERRLNVLITRARYRCVVFSNFRASDLTMDATASRGLQVLKQFLTYAETGQIPSTTISSEDTESPFEEEVRRFLVDQGYQVHAQVGCAGFRVDLAIVDPDRPGEYLIAVECDGAMYHSSRVARDRDRLRQQILEGLGWRIVRVWSTDWFQEPRASRERLLSMISERRREPRSCPGTSAATGVDEVRDGSIDAEVHHFGREERDDNDAAEIDGEPISGPTITTLVQPYAVLSGLRTGSLGDLREASSAGLAGLVARIVEVEGPVHEDVVAQRLYSAFNVKRSGKLVRGAVDRGIETAIRLRQVIRAGPFLWPPAPPKVLVRRRGEDEVPVIDYICNEEIAAATLLVLRTQLATAKDDLAVQTLRVLGFGRINGDVKTRALGIIDDLLAHRTIIQQAGGLIDLAESVRSSEGYGSGSPVSP